MANTAPPDDRQRRQGEAINKQPYSVDPAASPVTKKDAAGPKRHQEKPGQALDEPLEGDDDGK